MTQEKTQKTAVIWNELVTSLTFFVISADWSRFDGIMINEWGKGEENEDLQMALSDFVFGNSGDYQIPEATKDEFMEAVRNGAHVIVCGFLP